MTAHYERRRSSLPRGWGALGACGMGYGQREGGGLGGEASITALPAALLHSVESSRPQPKLLVLGFAEWGKLGLK